jgi:hypothetical protein
LAPEDARRRAATGRSGGAPVCSADDDRHRLGDGDRPSR